MINKSEEAQKLREALVSALNRDLTRSMRSALEFLRVQAEDIMLRELRRRGLTAEPGTALRTALGSEFVFEVRLMEVPAPAPNAPNAPNAQLERTRTMEREAWESGEQLQP